MPWTGLLSCYMWGFVGLMTSSVVSLPFTQTHKGLKNLPPVRQQATEMTHGSSFGQIKNIFPVFKQNFLAKPELSQNMTKKSSKDFTACLLYHSTYTLSSVRLFAHNTWIIV